MAVKYEAKEDTAASAPDPVNFNNVGWFKLSELGDCRNSDISVQLLDLITGNVLQTQPLGCHATIVFAGATGKGVRIVSADGTFAIGLYSADLSGLQLPLAQYSVAAFCNDTPGVGCDYLDFQRLVVNSYRFRALGTSYSPQWTEDSFFVLGTPDVVRDRLMMLKADPVCEL